MALEKQRMYRKNIDGTKDLIYRESSSDVVKHGSSTVEGELNKLNTSTTNLSTNKMNSTKGTALDKFTDIFVGECSIGTSGHTKLPNGMILQWGECKGTGAVSFPIPFPNACLQVFIDGMLSTSSSPIYKTLSCAFGFNKVNFTAVTYGYHDLGAQGTAQASMMYKNIVGSANFQGFSRWYAIGY